MQVRIENSIATIIPAVEEKQIEIEEQHSLLKTILLHLVPGAFIYGIFLTSAPLFERWGYPGIMGLVLGGTLVLLSTLANLYSMGRKRNGKFSLQGIVLYRKRMPWWQYPLWTIVSVIYSVLVLAFFAPLFQNQMMAWFSWWPGYTARLNLGNYPASHVLVAEILFIVLNTFFPIIEELYFRGYLLPRISRFGAWAPVINVTLFSLYHLWQPWNNVLNLLALWPLVLLPWKKRNVYLAMAIHCVLNIVGMFL